MQVISKGHLVATAVLIHNEQKQVLLGLRTKEQVWASFGGVLEPGESIEAGALREIEEETGLLLDGVEHLTFGEGVKADGTRYLTLYLLAALPEGQTPKLKEPDKMQALCWYNEHTLPETMWPRERSVVLDVLATL